MFHQGRHSSGQICSKPSASVTAESHASVKAVCLQCGVGAWVARKVHSGPFRDLVLVWASVVCGWLVQVTGVLLVAREKHELG